MRHALLAAIYFTMPPEFNTGGSLLAAEGLTAFGRRPAAFDRSGGVGAALAEGGLAAIEGVDAIEANPAMIGQARTYRLSGTYVWPGYGRPFYKGAVLDSKTSQIAAGVSYLASQDEYQDYRLLDRTDRAAFLGAQYDSPISKRVTLSLGQNFNHFSLGFQAVHVEGIRLPESVLDSEKIQGLHFGFGGAMLLSPALRVAAAVRGLGDRRISEFDPGSRQLGIAMLLGGGMASVNLDYLDRARAIQEFKPSEQDFSMQTFTSEGVVSDSLSDREQSVVLSGLVDMQGVVRLLGAFSQEIGGPGRQSAGAGLAIINGNWTLAYAHLIPYLGENKQNQSISFGLDLQV